MAGLRKSIVAALALGCCVLLSTCQNGLLGTVQIMLEESTAPMLVSFQPEPGTYTTPQSVQLSANKNGATIRYTTDGTDPTEQNGLAYSVPVTVAASTTIRARAFKELYSDSAVAVGGFTIPFGGQVKRYASDAAASDELGQAVAIDGDYAIVGAPFEDGAGNDRGAAYIFHRTGSYTWDAGVKIVATNPTDAHEFGFAVDIDGDYAIVGTQNWLGRTSAYIFHRTGTNTWDGGVKIDTANPQDYGYFGDAVSICGDYAVVGAFGENGGPGGLVTDAGAAYVFHREGLNAWSAPVRLLGFDSQTIDAFGHCVSIDGDYIVAGAPWYNAIGGGADDCGAAYLFHRTGTNSWESGEKILAGATTEAGAELGCSVAISGDYGIIGAQNQDVTLISQAGAAYTIHRTGTNTWELGGMITATDPQTMDYFGSEVAISGDYAIGAAKMEDEAGDRAGAVYTFHRTGLNTWGAGPTAKWVASDGGTMQFFGCSVGIDGMYAIVGASGVTAPGSLANAGAAYILH